MNVHEAKVYKKGLYDVLFSKQNKLKKKINLIIFITFAVISIYSFVMISINDDDLKRMAWIFISQAFSILFAAAGYRWLNKAGINYKKELKWFYISIGIAFAFAFSHWAFSENNTSFKMIWTFVLAFAFFLLAHSLFTAIRDSSRKWTKWIKPISLSSFIVSLSLGSLLIMQTVDVGRTIITFIVIFFLIPVGLLIYRAKITPRSAKSILENGNSLRVLIIALLIGPFVMGIKEFIFDFEFEASSFAIAGGQIIFGIISILMILNNKDEFKTSFVKSFVSNVGIFVQAGLILVARETQAAYTDYDYIYILNIIMGIGFVFALTFINAHFNVSRKSKFMLIDSITLFAFWSSMSTLVVLYLMDINGTFNNTVGYDEAILYFPFVTILINLAMSTMDWWKLLSTKKREKIWN